MYMIIEPQEHDFIVIHSPTKARTKHSQRFFFYQFSSNSTATFKHFGPLYSDQPLVKQKNRAFKIPEYCSGLPGEATSSLSLPELMALFTYTNRSLNNNNES